MFSVLCVDRTNSLLHLSFLIHMADELLIDHCNHIAFVEDVLFVSGNLIIFSPLIILRAPA